MPHTASVTPETVSAWLDDGFTLDEIERQLLNPAPLSEEGRAALWLYAWSVQRRRHRRWLGARPSEPLAELVLPGKRSL